MRPVYPILIRNEFGPLLRIEITVGKVDPTNVHARDDVRLTSVSLSLEGTDDLADLQSLTLYSTGDSEDLVQRQYPETYRMRETVFRTPFGQPQAPRRTMTFPADMVLCKGLNVFWVSGRLKDSASLFHRLKLSCTAIGTTAGSLAPMDPTPGVRQRIGVAVRKHKDNGVDTYGVPSLTTTAAGTLLAVYDARWRSPGHDLQGDIDTGLSRSTDGGRTWEPMRIIMDMGEFGGLPQDQNGVSDPGIIVDQQTGEIFCFAVWMNGKPGKHQWVGDGGAPGFEIGVAPQIILVRSSDDGRTWSAPQDLTRTLKKAAWWLFAPAPQQGFQIADGTLVMPMEGRDETGRKFSTIMTSLNHGTTWTVGTPVLSDGECAAAQLGDGSIMLNTRNREQESPATFHFRGVYITRDFGRTWTDHPTNFNTLIDPTCNGTLLRMNYEDGGGRHHLLLFANPHARIRMDQTIQVSFDDGLTWPRDHDLLLDHGFGWGYPSLTRVDAGHVGILYGGSQADLTFQSIPLSELLTPLSQP